MAEPFDLSPVVEEPVPPGSNLLVIGNAMSDTRGALVDLLTGDFRETDAAVAASTNGETVDLLRELSERTGTDDRLRGIDCSQGGPVADDRISSVNSPADLTGIGMHVDRHLGEFAEADYRVRLGFDSLSTLLVYSDFQPVYRFVHVITGRVSAVDGLGVFVIDSETHDEQAMNAITALFDAKVAVGEEGTTVDGFE